VLSDSNGAQFHVFLYPSDKSSSEKHTVFLKHQLLRKSLTGNDVRQTNTHTHTHTIVFVIRPLCFSSVALSECWTLRSVFSVSPWAPAGTDGLVSWPLSDFSISIIIVLFPDSPDHPYIQSPSPVGMVNSLLPSVGILTKVVCICV